MKYQIEVERTNITPKAFYRYCKRRCEEKGLDIEVWTDYEGWENPINPERYTESNHEDWEEPKKEAYKHMPYDCQLFLEGTYNFIMEFQFWDEKKGSGYLFAIEQ